MSPHLTDASPGAVRVSVIVPVRNRRDLLVGLLAALDAQTFGDFEVIVVDDGSSDGADELAGSAVVAGRAVRLRRSDGEGAVAARTLGVAASDAEILAFTDSDCLPAADWLARGMAAIDAGADVVNGRTVPARVMRPRERSMASGREGLYPTCNVFYRRTVFDRAGGFDAGAAVALGFRMGSQARGTGFGEDTLLAWRARRAGAVVTYDPDAVVRHHVFPPDWRDLARRCPQVAAFPALVRDVPELRTTMMRYGVQFGDRSRAPAYVFAMTLPTRRPALVAAALGWWALRRLRDLRASPVTWPQRIAAVPAEMATDAAMGAAYLVGSIRARTVVL
jgi:hypothetical protein